MENNKGITLIALVITIIVLLILAGVSIAMLTGENGLLKKATAAKTETETANNVEKINIVLQAAYTELLSNDAVTKTELEDMIKKSEPSFATSGFTVATDLKPASATSSAADIVTLTLGGKTGKITYKTTEGYKLIVAK